MAPATTVYNPTTERYSYGFAPMSPEDIKKANDFAKAIEQLRKAKTETEKEESRKVINDMVSEQLDRDLAEREKRLAEIEAKAKELREQLTARKQSKAEIQKMLVLLIENPQGGLGLPPAWMNQINNSYPTFGSFPSAPQPTARSSQ